jgi:hypothetical protein
VCYVTQGSRGRRARLSHILLQQNLFAFEILKTSARGPYMKGRTSGRFFNASGQVRYLQPVRRKVNEGMDQAHAFFRQREHEGVDQRRQMKAIRDFGEWLWRIRQAERSQRGRRGEHRQSIGQLMPERIDRIRLCALELSDLAFILDVMLCAREAIELLLEGGDLGLVDATFTKLRQCFLDVVLERGERGAIEFDIASKGDVGKYRETQVSP